MSETVRYCPECASIGEVRPGARSCCPTSKPVQVPPAVASQAKLGFLRLIELFEEDQGRDPNTDAYLVEELQHYRRRPGKDPKAD